MQGVAPEATVLLYKVRNGNRTSKEELEVNIKAAIKRAFVMGADVINISVGRSHVCTPSLQARINGYIASARGGVHLS